MKRNVEPHDFSPQASSLGKRNMRQSNNALTFLSSSYQAVFKHAYFTGLASSAALLAASPYAIASVNANWDNQSLPSNNLSALSTGNSISVPSHSGTGLIIDKDSTSTWYSSNNYFESLTVTDNKSFTLASYYDNNIKQGANTGFYAKNTILIEDGGKFFVKGRNNYLQVVQGAENESGSITGDLYVTSGSISLENAIMKVNEATISSGTITIKGLNGKDGQSGSDIYANYSSLNTGMNNGETTVSDSIINIEEYGAFNALGVLTLNGSKVNFGGEKTTSSTKYKYQHGMEASNAQLWAENATIANNSKLNVSADNTAGIFVNNLKLGGSDDSGSTLNIGSGSEVQIASKFTNTFVVSKKEIAQGVVLQKDNFLNTNFVSGGALTIDNFQINNSGTLTLGATSYEWTIDDVYPTKATALDYTVYQNSGRVINHSGATLNIGDAFDIADACSTAAYNTKCKFDTNSGTTYNLKGGSLENAGLLNINAGAKLNVLDGAFTNKGHLNIEASGTMSITSAALSAQSGDKYYSATDGTEYVSSDLSNLGNVNNFGTITLNDGLFIATVPTATEAESSPTLSIGEKFANALNGSGSDDLGHVYFNDAILMLENAPLNTSSEKLASGGITGSGDSTLYSKGDIDFTVNGSGDDLNGFTTILGKKITFYQDNTSATTVTLKSDPDTVRTFAATKKVTTNGGSPLSLENFKLRLTDDRLLTNTNLALDPSLGFTTEEKSINVDLILNSGSSLDVEFGKWYSPNDITANGNATVNIIGTAKDSEDNIASTNSHLIAQNMTLNDESKLISKDSNLSLYDVLLSGSATAEISDSTGVKFNSLTINTDQATEGETVPGLYLNNSKFSVTKDVVVSNGILATNYPKYDLPEGSAQNSEFHIWGNLTVSGSGQVQLNKVSAFVEKDLTINADNTDESSGGLWLSESGFKAKSNVLISNGVLAVNDGLSDSSQNYNFNVYGDMTVSGSGADVSLNYVNATIGRNNSGGSINLYNSSSFSINNSQLTASSIDVKNNSKFETSNSDISSKTLTASDSGSFNFTNGSIVNIIGDDKISTVDISGDITLSNSTLKLGDASDSLALRYDSGSGFTVGNGSSFTPIKVTEGSFIEINLDKVLTDGTNLSFEQLGNLTNLLQSGNGIVRFEGEVASNINLKSEYNNDKQRWEVDSTILSNIEGIKFSIDETKKSVLIKVNGAIAGEWAGIETDGCSTSFDVNARQSLSILGHANPTADKDNLNLAQNEQGYAVGVNLGYGSSGASLNIDLSGLEEGFRVGKIGNIVEKLLGATPLEGDNSSSETLSSTLNIKNADNITVVAVEGASNSQIKVGNFNVTDAGVTVDEIAANKATFSNGKIFNAENINITDIEASNSSFTSDALTASSMSGSGNTMDVDQIDISNANLTNAKISADKLNLGDALLSSSTIDVDNIKISGSGNFVGGTVTATNFTGNKLNLDGTNMEVFKTLNASGDFTAKGGNVTAENFTGTSLSLDGTNMEVDKLLTATGPVQIKGGAKLVAENMQLGSGDFSIGTEGDDSSTGHALFTNLDLNGNNLLLDPEFGQATATLFVENIGDIDTDGSLPSDVTQINGNIIVGKNSALGIGGSEQEFLKELAKHQDSTTQSLKKDSIGALLYVNRNNIQLGDNQLIIGTDDIETLKGKLSDTGPTIYLGANSGLQVSANALSAAKADKGKEVFSDLDSTDTIESNGGTLIIPALATSQDLAEIFGTQVQLASGSSIKVQTANGLISGTIDSTDDLQGFDDILSIDKNARNALGALSTPTYNYYMNHLVALNQNSSQPSDDTVVDTPVTPSPDTTPDTGSDTTSPENGTSDTESNVDNVDNVAVATMLANISTPRNTPDTSSVGYNFLSQAGGENPLAIEQSARLAAFGMSTQIAHQTAQATSDAISKRLNIAIGSSSIQDSTVVSNNKTAVWMSPTYQNLDSSEFDANDRNYGADVDIYGMVAGADYTFNNGLKVGAAINFGKGDSSGVGSAQGVSNDFNYYGLGLYTSFNPIQNLTLSADATYTSVDNDISTHANVTDFDKITGSTDSKAFSIGANAQYKFKIPGLDIVPHAGLRYTHISVDDYSTKVDGKTLGHTSTGSASVVSIPVGVAVSSELKVNDWIVKPHADVTLTANLGDDSFNSTSTFEGMPDQINYNTEFMDDFNYGVDAGLQVSKGNFTFGADVGYTGSSNTNDFSVGANVKFKF